MYWQIAYFIFGLVLANFWIWRLLRIEYESGHIFEVTFWLSLAAIIGIWWPIIAIAVITLILVVYSKRLHIDFWQWWDVVLPMGLLLFAPLAPWKVALNMLGFWLGLALISRFYRRFSWYVSGRLGFVGSVAVIAWVIVQIELAKGGVLWVYLGLPISIAALVNIYVRSGQKIWPLKRNHPNR